MKFLLDAQLPLRLKRALARGGHTALHITETGMLKATDRLIWDFAAKSGEVIVSRDAGFAAQRIHAGNGPAVVWVRHERVTSDGLVKSLVTALPEIATALAAGEGVVEVG